MERPPTPIRRYIDYDFTNRGFEGFQARVWVNPPVRLLEEIGKSEERSREIILEIYPEWNFIDTEGVDIPHSTEGLREMGADLVMVLAGSIREIVLESAKGSFNRAS